MFWTRQMRLVLDTILNIIPQHVRTIYQVISIMMSQVRIKIKP